jgi:hypothetical protein
MNGLLSITKINYQRANILKYTIIIYYLSVCGNIASSKFSRNQLDPENPSRIGEPTRTSQVVSGVNHQVKRHITSRMGWDRAIHGSSRWAWSSHEVFFLNVYLFSSIYFCVKPCKIQLVLENH